MRRIRIYLTVALVALAAWAGAAALDGGSAKLAGDGVHCCYPDK
jgi:hypothetical protein